MTDDDKPRLEIDWLRTLAGALAAVSSAVLLSTLGAAGTIIGAALGSVVVTIGSALYSQGLARSRYRLAKAQTVALRKVGIAQAEVRRASRHQGDDRAVEGHLDHADVRLAEARRDLDAAVQEPATLGWGERLALLPWKRIALLAAGLFVVVVVAITAFELVAGRSVSSYTGGTSGSGGTSITHVTGGGPAGEPAQQESPTPSPSTSPTSPSSEDTTGITPGAEPTTPTPSSTPEPTAPTTSTAPGSSPGESPTTGSTSPVPTLPSDSASAVPSP